VTGAGGVEVPQVEATYAVDGGEPFPCEAAPLVAGSFLCGRGLTGLFTLAVDGWGFVPQQAEVEVLETDDGCRDPVTATLDMVLDPVLCPDIERPTLRVLVIDSSGGAVPGAEVEFLPLGQDWTSPMACLAQDARTFVCTGEYPGEVELWVYGTGFEMHYETLEVREDECGVVTRDVTVVMKK
jgi:hypothetical protein